MISSLSLLFFLIGMCFPVPLFSTVSNGILPEEHSGGSFGGAKLNAFVCMRRTSATYKEQFEGKSKLLV